MILQFLRYWQNHIYANDLHKLSYHSHILKNIVSYFSFLPALPGRGGILLNIKCIYSGNFIGFNSLHFAIRVFVKIHVVDSLSIFYDVVRLSLVHIQMCIRDRRISWQRMQTPRSSRLKNGWKNLDLRRLATLQRILQDFGIAAQNLLKNPKKKQTNGTKADNGSHTVTMRRNGTLSVGHGKPDAGSHF